MRVYKRPKKYHYKTETCDDCGHTTRYRVYGERKKKFYGVSVVDVTAELQALDCGPMPLTQLMRGITPYITTNLKAIKAVKTKAIKTRHGKLTVVTHKLLGDK